MNNEEFQKLMIEKLTENDKFQKVVINEIRAINGKISNVETRLGTMETRLDKIEIRQDEIYQVARAIEHNNQVGRSELDSHNIRIAKVEGKLKKAAKVFNQDIEVDKASNL